MGLRFQVLFHSPRWGSFRLSLTVLLRYRSYQVFSLGSWSTRIPTRFLVPRRTQDSATVCTPFQIRGFHPLWPAFPKPFSYNVQKDVAVLQPRPYGRFRLFQFRSPLLSKSLLFSLPRVLRWFSSPSFASPAYLFSGGITGSLPLGYPIRLSTDHGMFAPPRRFSQLTTAFFASIRQGILHKPFSRLTILLFPSTILQDY